MADLMIARVMFAAALIFHIVFAALGIGLPFMMVWAEGLWLKTRDRVWLDLAKRWAKAAGVLFAVGAVTGTLVSIELGLLWPIFVEDAMPIIGLPFAIEGFAFFLEAIFLGIYLYGWDRVSPKTHWFAGVIVALSAAASGFLILTVNGWMNTPVGFDLVGTDLLTGTASNIRPLTAMFAPNTPHTIVHMLIACYTATAFVLLGVHSYGLYRGKARHLHRKAISIVLIVGLVGAVGMAASGDWAAGNVAENQPVKFAAMEGQWETETCAPLTIGGIPDAEAEETHYGVEIPCALSLLAGKDPNYEVQGLSDVPAEDRPDGLILVHWSFDFMVGLGTLMIALAGLSVFLWWKRKRIPEDKWLLRTFMVTAPAGMLALELGWIVTEVGRQPWVIQDLLRTEDAVTSVEGLIWPFLLFSGIFLFLAAVVITFVRRFLLDADDAEDLPAYLDGPAAGAEIDEDEMDSSDESSEDDPTTEKDLPSEDS